MQLAVSTAPLDWSLRTAGGGRAGRHASGVRSPGVMNTCSLFLKVSQTKTIGGALPQGNQISTQPGRALQAGDSLGS